MTRGRNDPPTKAETTQAEMTQGQNDPEPANSAPDQLGP